MSEYFFVGKYGNFRRPGYIPESFVEKAYGFYERRGAPFLQKVKNAHHEIYYDGQVLHLGKPEDLPRLPTWREYYLKYEGHTQKDLRTKLREIHNNLDYEELDEEMSCEYFYDQWARNHSPAAEFAHLVDHLSVGVENPKAGRILGSLKRHEGSFTGSDVLCMTLDEPITLSWLQWALQTAGRPSNVHDLWGNRQ